MRHVISVLLQNEVGALTRMTGLFSTRGYNIDSLNVAPTNDPAVSRVTLVIEGSDAAIAQLNTQLAKLVDVVNIHDMTLGEHFERELAIIKLKLATGGQTINLFRLSMRPGMPLQSTVYNLAESAAQAIRSGRLRLPGGSASDRRYRTGSAHLEQA